MEYQRTVTVNTTVDRVWSLINQLRDVAECIPGLSEFEDRGPEQFGCLMTQKVGHVKTQLRLDNRLTDIEPFKKVTVTSQGDDKRLRASVRTVQTFELTARDDTTEVGISADIHVTGSIATFGGRVILAKTEQIVVEALGNVERLLQSRSSTEPGTD